MKPNGDIGFTDSQGEGNFFDRQVFEIKACHRLEVFRQSPHRFCKVNQLERSCGFLMQRRRGIGNRVGQRLGTPHQSAPDMGDADVLRDARYIAFQHSLVIQTRKGLPDGNPDILRQIIDQIGVTFIHARNAAHHCGMDPNDLVQLDCAASRFFSH